MKRMGSFLALFAGLLMTVAAMAQVEEGRNWGDWVEICAAANPDGSGKKVCRIAQFADLNMNCIVDQMEDGRNVIKECHASNEEPLDFERRLTQRVMETSIGYVDGSDDPVLFVQANLSLGVYTAKTITVTIDGEEAAAFPFQRCTSNGCLGVLQMSEDLVSKMRKGKEAKLTYFRGANQPFELPVSLDGFSKAIKALK